jgi:plastocyanin domain-containing protein
MTKRYLPFLIISLFFTHLILIQGALGEKASFTAGIDSDGVQRASILGGEYFFKPDYIIVKVNVPVELRVRKKSLLTPHNIIMNEPETGIVFKESFGKKPHVIKFTPKETGKFPFYCDKKLLFFKSHREKGMEGILVVID